VENESIVGYTFAKHLNISCDQILGSDTFVKSSFIGDFFDPVELYANNVKTKHVYFIGM
jgi:hypothetical protein